MLGLKKNIKKGRLFLFLNLFILLGLSANGWCAAHLEAVRVSDYVTYTHINFEFSSKYVRGEVFRLTDEHLIVKVRGFTAGSYPDDYSVDSFALDKIAFSRDNRHDQLTITIPLNSKVNTDNIHYNFWDYMLTIDLPLIHPNNTRIPQLEAIRRFKQSGGKVVVIDPGHGGHDPGAQAGYAIARGIPRMNEKTLALDMANRLKTLFDNDPTVNAFLTRVDDYLPVPFGLKGKKRDDYRRESLRYRVQLAKEYLGDVYISIHLNAPPRYVSHYRPRGFEIYYLSDERVDDVFNQDLEDLKALQEEEEQKQETTQDDELLSIISTLKRDKVPADSKFLAGYILEEVDNLPGIVMRQPAMKPNRFIVLQQPNMPSVLVELGFITHPKDHAYYRTAENRNSMAMALYKAIVRKPTGQLPDSVIAMMKEQEALKTTPAVSSNPRYHIVRRNETLSTIAQKYGVSTSSLRSLNRNVIGRRSLIHVGDKLRIPSDAHSSSGSSTQTISYKVRSGDTLAEIAKKYNTDVSTIMRLNNKRSSRIYPNDVLTIKPGNRTTTYASARPIRIKVRAGDTLGKIAHRYNTTVRRLQQANRIRGTLIHPGQSLLIP